MYKIQDREAGNKIESFPTLEEAKKALKLYEETDMLDGIYEPDFYEIVEEIVEKKWWRKILQRIKQFVR